MQEMFAVVGTHHSPVIIHLLQGDRVEDNAGHHPGQDGPVLDEPVVVRGGFLLDDGDDPFQHFVLQLQVFLQEMYSQMLKTKNVQQFLYLAGYSWVTLVVSSLQECLHTLALQ